MNSQRLVGVGPAVSGLIIGTAVLSRVLPASFALDRPTHSSTAILAGAGGAVVAFSRWLPGREHEQRGRKDQREDEQLPLTEGGRPPSPRPEHVTSAGSLRTLRICFLLLVALTCLRVEVLRQVVDNVQCASHHWHAWTPLALAAWEGWRARKFSSTTVSRAADQAGLSLLRRLVALPCARVVATLGITLGASLVLESVASPRSTYICAASLPYRLTVPAVQRVGSVVDVALVYCIGELLCSRAAKKLWSTSNRFAEVGLALLVCAGFWLTVGGVYWLVQETGRKWLLTIPPVYFRSVMKLNVYIALTLICALLAIHHVGIVTTSIIATTTSLITTTTADAWTNAQPFPTLHMGVACCGMLCLLAFLLLYLQTEAHPSERQADAPERLLHRIPAWAWIVCTAFAFLWLGLWVSYHHQIAAHPIDMAMHKAQERHGSFAAQASTSRTLAQAAQAYRTRHKRHPPPGFDDWFEFANSRNSVIIDDFDSIHRDLLPFHALSPEDIRDRTWTLIANPWNDVAGISIRAGKVAISPNVVPTHLWMLEGIVSMVSKFADKLPDMDLAFNLNDECRVSVPHEDVEPMRARGRQAQLPNEVEHSWTASRHEQWRPVPEEPLQDSPLREASWEPVFHRFGNTGCSSSSPARTRRTWDTGTLCRDCVRPHSMGAFLGNWTIASDVCHQPDLADLHGLYLSPAAFKLSPQLYPVFSQSKAGGFNDILYPSAWNYIDKAKYEPTTDRPDLSFPEKKSTLFWRGATSEGFSHGGFTGQWRGMARQRFVHLANDINGTTPDQPLLVASSGDQMRYETFPVRQLSSFLATDVHFVESILRCGGRDCSDQAREFEPLVAPLDFQEHWQYKYLLDLDGAGFSGRFLPFLQSHSLPFKAALFREWWDDRVEAWVHFVPLDLRGHGLWATLAYFQGLYATIGGRQVAVEAHQREAERIAVQGREWAEQVLRKEDMEVYMFRLLLEWGRLTDDKRDTLGFVV